MPKFNPYDSFGRILSEGGEQSLALAIYHGASDDDMAALRARRFASLSDDEFAALSAFAYAGLAAGRRAGVTPPDQQIPASELPVNSVMGGDDAEGQRTRYIGEVEFEESGKRVRVYGWFPGIPTNQELLDAIEEAGRDLGERYPGKFGLSEGEPVGVSNVNVVFTARRF